MANATSGHHRSPANTSTEEYNRKLAIAEAKSLGLKYCEVCIKVADSMFSLVNDTDFVCSRSCMQRYYVRELSEDERKTLERIKAVKEAELLQKAEEKKKILSKRSMSTIHVTKIKDGTN